MKSKNPKTRGEAKKLGVRFFYTGRPCKRGHLSKRSAHNGGCIECKNLHAVRSRALNIEKSREKMRRWKGLPEPTHKAPKRCEICDGLPNGRGGLHLDHDHKTDEFRGWLCHGCNTAIGRLGDSVDGLCRALAYLERNIPCSYAFVMESNRIEGIMRPPSVAEVKEFERFMDLEKITVDELNHFVSVYEPSARLRNAVGLNVSIGGRYPPFGGPKVEEMLVNLLEDIVVGLSAYYAHVRYEFVHPYTDCNGRSGRMLWAWQMGESRLGVGFLHRFYYQTLQHSGRKI